MDFVHPSAPLSITFLGTGTSQGVPVIGCTCGVCQSDDPRDHRLRTAALLRSGDQYLAIDAGPDFRQQMLRSGISRLSAVLLTHEHNDHVAGMDDLRPFIFTSRREMTIYALPRVLGHLRTRFSYAFEENPYPGAPRFDLQAINQNSYWEWAGLSIQAVGIQHGSLPILGFRVGNLAYLTDVHTIADSELEKVSGVDTLVISALHHTSHHSHISLEEALAFIERIQPRKAFLTHLSHRMGFHREVSRQLPAGVRIAHDQLTVYVHPAPQ